MRIVIILGSARSRGNTFKVVQYLRENLEADYIDLNRYDLKPYNYNHGQTDDFLALMEELIENYDCLVFATPIYWYSMSGIMKNFLDRFTDLLKVRKDLGRKLRTKSMAVLSCSGDDDQEAYFWQAFKNSAEYLGMSYVGQVHSFVENELIPDSVKSRLQEFGRIINQE